MEINFVILNLT